MTVLMKRAWFRGWLRNFLSEKFGDIEVCLLTCSVVVSDIISAEPQKKSSFILHNCFLINSYFWDLPDRDPWYQIEWYIILPHRSTGTFRKDLSKCTLLSSFWWMVSWGWLFGDNIIWIDEKYSFHLKWSRNDKTPICPGTSISCRC